jgi:hypothetical protein
LWLPGEIGGVEATLADDAGVLPELPAGGLLGGQETLAIQ